MNCYVLTGGAATRMGTAKEQLTLGGHTFLDRIVTVASPLFDEVVVVTKKSKGPGPYRTIFEDREDIAAPIFGIACAFTDAGEADSIFVLAVDYPLISRELLAFLLDRFSGSEAEILVPRTEGKTHMLCGIYRQSVAPSIAEHIALGRYKLRGLLERHRSVVIEEDELERFGIDGLINVNTQQDYADVVARKGGESG